MFQKFYTDTLGGRFIKSLLAQTPIPVFDSVVDGDHIIAGCYYVYKNYIIKCNTTGVLAVSKHEDLYPSDNLYPSVMLFVETGIRAATFYVKGLVSQYSPKTHSTFVSSTNYYDSETHLYLSKYLRYILTTTDLNLFPFYNCYNGTYLPDVELVYTPLQVHCYRVTKQTFKTIAIPILFGHTYTVAIDCPTEVLMRAIIYDSKTGFIDEETLPKDLVTSLRGSGIRYSRLNFKDPVKFRLECDSLAALSLQNNLYLTIQLPESNDSSIVVLENYEKYFGVKCNENGVKENTGVLNPSLLQMNSKNSYAFSDRLIEYLLHNVVHKDDTIVQNIGHCQSLLSNINQDYKQTFIKGFHKLYIWDNDLSQNVYSIAENYADKHNIYDQDGNFNKDIMSVIVSKGGAR